MLDGSIVLVRHTTEQAAVRFATNFAKKLGAELIDINEYRYGSTIDNALSEQLKEKTIRGIILEENLGASGGKPNFLYCFKNNPALFQEHCIPMHVFRGSINASETEEHINEIRVAELASEQQLRAIIAAPIMDVVPTFRTLADRLQNAKLQDDMQLKFTSRSRASSSTDLGSSTPSTEFSSRGSSSVTSPSNAGPAVLISHITGAEMNFETPIQISNHLSPVSEGKDSPGTPETKLTGIAAPTIELTDQPQPHTPLLQTENHKPEHTKENSTATTWYEWICCCRSTSRKNIYPADMLSPVFPSSTGLSK